MWRCGDAPRALSSSSRDWCPGWNCQRVCGRHRRLAVARDGFGHAWIAPPESFVGSTNLVAELRLSDDKMADQQMIQFEWVPAIAPPAGTQGRRDRGGSTHFSAAPRAATRKGLAGHRSHHPQAERHPASAEPWISPPPKHTPGKIAAEARLRRDVFWQLAEAAAAPPISPIQLHPQPQEIAAELPISPPHNGNQQRQGTFNPRHYLDLIQNRSRWNESISPPVNQRWTRITVTPPDLTTAHTQRHSMKIFLSSQAREGLDCQWRSRRRAACAAASRRCVRGRGGRGAGCDLRSIVLRALKVYGVKADPGHGARLVRKGEGARLAAGAAKTRDVNQWDALSRRPMSL